MKFTFDFTDLDVIARGLREVGPVALRDSAVAAVNAVTRRFDDLQRAAQIRDINLPRSRVDEVTSRTDAVPGPVVRATISTARKLTVMDRFGATPYRRPADLDRRGRRLGQRGAGVLLPIKPSSPKRKDALFMLPLRGQGLQGRRGVFVRTSAGKVEHLYGPSPYSLFAFQVRTRSDALLADLQREASQRMADAIERGLEAS